MGTLDQFLDNLQEQIFDEAHNFIPKIKFLSTKKNYSPIETGVPALNLILRPR